MSQSKNDWDIFEFTTQISKFIENHFKKALVLFAVIILGAGIYSYKKSLDRESEMKSFTALYKITKVYQAKKADFTEAKEPEAKEKPKTPKVDKPKMASGDLDKDYGQEVKQLEEFIDQNLGKNASGEAALILSEIYSEYKMPEKGAQALIKTSAKWGSRNVLYNVMQMRTGDLWALAEQCEKASQSWKTVAEGKSFMTSQAQLKLGVCLQQVGRTDEAKTWFEKIKANSPNSAEGFNAKRYLRFLDFKTNNQMQDSKSKAQQKSDQEDKAS